VTGEQRWHAIGAVEGAVLLVVHVYCMENENGEEETIRIISAREAHKRERRIFGKPVSKKRKAVLSRIAKRQAAGDDSDIDYSDIPPLTDEQLAQFRRTPKVLVAARIDREVYNWLMQYGKGYSTRINSILRTVMERAR
jgi:uncharacterized protein (DUF4415 family)